VLVAVVRRIVFWSQGISPALRGLGNGLSEAQDSRYLLEMKTRRYTRRTFAIQGIQGGKHLRYRAPEDIGSAKDATVFVMYWPDWADHLDAILNKKDRRNTANRLLPSNGMSNLKGGHGKDRWPP
jgi:hypothetical protein